MKRMSWGARVAWEIWLPIVLLVIWYFVSEQYNSFYFPPLSEILVASGEIWFWEGTVNDILPSLYRLISGFLIGTFVGVAVGIFLGLLKGLEDALRPVLEFVRATPGVALLPLVILFLGLGDSMKIVMIAIVSFWPVLLNTIAAVRSVEPVQLQVSRSPVRDALMKLSGDNLVDIFPQKGTRVSPIDLKQVEEELA